MSFKQRLKSTYTMTRFDFSWKMIPESWSRDRKRPITPGTQIQPYYGNFNILNCIVINKLWCIFLQQYSHILL